MSSPPRSQGPLPVRVPALPLAHSAAERCVPHSRPSSYYRGAHGVILVYDVTDQASFNHLASWIKASAAPWPPTLSRSDAQPCPLPLASCPLPRRPARPHSTTADPEKRGHEECSAATNRRTSTFTLAKRWSSCSSATRTITTRRWSTQTPHVSSQRITTCSSWRSVAPAHTPPPLSAPAQISLKSQSSPVLRISPDLHAAPSDGARLCMALQSRRLCPHPSLPPSTWHPRGIHVG